MYFESLLDYLCLLGDLTPSSLSKVIIQRWQPLPWILSYTPAVSPAFPSFSLVTESLCVFPLFILNPPILYKIFGDNICIWFLAFIQTNDNLL